MKHIWVCKLGILLVYTLLINGVSNSEVSEVSLGNILDQAPARRSLLSLPDEHDTLLVATLDGTINLVDPESARVLWSFASGPPIYSSYQAPINHDFDKENASGTGGRYFVDCGDDWKLFAHTELGPVNLDKSAEEFLRITPHITEDGGVVLGSKKTTVFLVDAKTGRLIHTYSLSDDPATSLSNEDSSFEDSSSLSNKSIEGWEKSDPVNLKSDELPLYITRTDYLLKSFAANSRKILWNVTVSDIGAAFLCQDTENSFRGPPMSLNELPSECGVNFNMPLSCQSKAIVFRLRTPHMLDSFSMIGMLPANHDEDLMLPIPSGNDILPPTPKVDKFLELYQKNDTETMLSLPTVTNISGISGLREIKMPFKHMFSGGSRVMSLIPFVLIVVGFFTYRCSLVAGKSASQNPDLNSKSASSKKKKLRKSGRSSGLIEKKGTDPLSGEDGYTLIDNGRNPLLDFYQSSEWDADGHTIGKLFVSSKEIAKGSNGTIVLEGIYEGREVAVKRLVKAHHDVAFKEIQNLIASDRHPNIVRWYGVEYDKDFVYLSLERCTCSLNDLILMYSDFFEKPACAEGQASNAMTEYKVRLDSMRGFMPGICLWRANGYPSPILLKLMRDVVAGLVHLHELGIIHRDLKPQNVLITKERSLCAKLSDMGISKRLVGDMSSLGHHATGYGSSGWQAPEQLLLGRQTRAVDLFSVGCVLFFCITGGGHPFGDHLERDINVTKNRVDLFLVQNIPEAVDLLSHLLDPRAECRPKALEVLHHPLFWSPEMRLSFLRDTSDRVELEDREAHSDILIALESIAPGALGGKWEEKLEPFFIANIGRYRRYKYHSVRDLLRVMRNKLNHYRELPKEIQELLGALPEGFDDYFASRFPKLLIEVYKVMCKFCKEEEWFQRYLISNLG